MPTRKDSDAPALDEAPTFPAPVADPVATAPREDLDSGEETVVVIGDGAAARDAARLLGEHSWRVVHFAAADGGKGRRALEEQLVGASVVIVDGTTGDRPSWALLDAVRETRPEAATILLSSEVGEWADFERVRAHRPRVVPAPVNWYALLSALDAALVYRNLLAENLALRGELHAATRLTDWVGCSAAADQIRSAITTAAFSERTVLVLGEDGTGRRLIAELVHRLGRRSSLAFLPLEAATLPDDELSAVFADLRRAAGSPGSYIRRARPGTVYLSGIERLNPRDRAALDDALRRPASFRIIASANPNVPQAQPGEQPVQKMFRNRDAFVIRTPRLADRRADIPLLVRHFLREACRDAGVPLYGVGSETIESYSAHGWPGNTAELRAHVERAVSTAAVSRHSGTILPDAVCALPGAPIPPAPALEARPLKETLGEIEKTIIQRALRRAGGNQKRAAAALRVNPTTLHEKMKRYGMIRPSRAAAAG